MAQVFEGGDSYFNAIVSGTPHQGTINYIRGQFSQPSTNLTEAGRRFQEQARVSFEKILQSNELRLAQAAVRRLDSLWDENSIRPLVTLGDFQYAPVVMQRFIMAEPTIRKLYHQQRCDGYSDTYIDMYPKDIGEDHYDYRRVMDGVVTFSETENEDGDLEWESTTYLDELVEDDTELLFEEQLDILESWDRMRAFMSENKDDPTSKYNAELE